MTCAPIDEFGLHGRHSDHGGRPSIATVCNSYESVACVSAEFNLRDQTPFRGVVRVCARSPAHATCTKAVGDGCIQNFVELQVTLAKVPKDPAVMIALTNMPAKSSIAMKLRMSPMVRTATRAS